METDVVHLASPCFLTALHVSNTSPRIIAAGQLAELVGHLSTPGCSSTEILQAIKAEREGFEGLKKDEVE
jgi:hypothetical protein